ncbi:rhodanese-like domain-containing protein [Gottfriedia sp. NPDC056225]|uniref:rhodanese-like domain-containing protein n=1 Tax=Bacillaceae TaxID=186817 RepID=UPI000BF02995|nr:rhodanese-like domain-containing protein [Bacillus sp. AFS002410]PEJ58997.1 rhodanese [Bacillus sp. AFS002410]QKE72230.1 rhodanese-like domain-containing protein [Arthrobacter citreus]
MDILNGIIIVLIAYFLMQTFLPVKGVKQISTDELKNELKNKEKQFIDVRTSGEFKGRHIKEFKNIPLHILKKNVNDLSKEQETIIICQSGVRSKKACKVLKKMGYTNITNVKGGMGAWS